MNKVGYALAFIASIVGVQLLGTGLLDTLIYNYTGEPLHVKLNLKGLNDRDLDLSGKSLSETLPVGLADTYRTIEVWGPHGKAKLFRDKDEFDYFKNDKPHTKITEDMIYKGDKSLWPSGTNPREVHIYPNEVNGVTVGDYRVEVR